MQSSGVTARAAIGVRGGRSSLNAKRLERFISYGWQPEVSVEVGRAGGPGAGPPAGVAPGGAAPSGGVPVASDHDHGPEAAEWLLCCDCGYPEYGEDGRSLPEGERLPDFGGVPEGTACPRCGSFITAGCGWVCCLEVV
jgi:hypothetical protein